MGKTNPKVEIPVDRDCIVQGAINMDFDLGVRFARPLPVQDLKWTFFDVAGLFDDCVGRVLASRDTIRVEYGRGSMEKRMGHAGGLVSFVVEIENTEGRNLRGREEIVVATHHPNKLNNLRKNMADVTHC